MQDGAFFDVNGRGVLRVPWPLWLGFAVLARYWFAASRLIGHPAGPSVP